MLVISPELIVEARQLLDRARVIAEASAGQPGEGARRHPESHPPAGVGSEDRSTLDQIGARLVAVIAADDQIAMVAWIKWATDELRALTHGPDRHAETPGQFRWRICHDYEGITASMVARRELTSITTVRKLRVEDGRDAARGRKLAGEEA